jgi:NAD(P)-dependent dehydrogenase (short-subunit alcohol dehydrogenase family)
MGERLAGKVALVAGGGQTQGENIGNGRATAILFAREGATVLVMDRDGAAAAATVEAIEADGGAASAIEGDVSSETDAANAVAACVERLGALDVLHHNVGIGPATAGPSGSTSPPGSGSCA